MRIAKQVYFCGISGMVGGLLAWLTIGQLDASRWRNIWLATAIQGGGVGLFLAVALTTTRGVVERWSYGRLVQSLRLCAVAGLVAGTVGLLIGQVVFVAAHGGWIGRPAGWLSMCVLIGLTQAGQDASKTRSAVGCLAGLVAGAVCGLFYEGLTQTFLAQSGTAQLWATCIGFMAVGGVFAAGIPTAERLASTAVVVIRSGARSGNEYILLDQLLIGRSEECRVMLLDDPDVDDRHVLLEASDGKICVRNLGRTAIDVNGAAVAPSAATMCGTNANLRVGQTRVAIL